MHAYKRKHEDLETKEKHVKWVDFQKPTAAISIIFMYGRTTPTAASDW